MPFDGKFGVFAHTLTPSRGNVHFDDSEIWTTGTTRGKVYSYRLLYYVSFLINTKYISY